LNFLWRTESAPRSFALPLGRLDVRSGHGLPNCRTRNEEVGLAEGVCATDDLSAAISARR
jgi:hypothetical protein